MARTFSGTSQYITLPIPIVKALPLTLSAWFRPNNVTGNKAILGNGGESGATRIEWTILIVNNAFWALAQYDTNSKAISTATLAANTWYHGCGVFAASNNRQAYINGGNLGTDTNIIIPDPNNMFRTRIGQRVNDLDDQEFAGWIAECSAWNAALTASEVYLLSRGIPPYLIRPRYLQAYIPLLRDEDTNVIQPRYLPRLSASKFVVTGAPGVAPHPPGIIQRAAFANSLTFDPATNWPEYRPEMPLITGHIPSTSAPTTATGAVIRSPMWGTY